MARLTIRLKVSLNLSQDISVVPWQVDDWKYIKKCWISRSEMAWKSSGGKRCSLVFRKVASEEDHDANLFLISLSRNERSGLNDLNASLLLT